MTKIDISYWKQFAKAAFVRATRTFFQALLASMPATGFMLGDIEWTVCLSSAAGAALLSVINSIITGLPEVKMPNEMIDEKSEVSADDISV